MSNIYIESKPAPVEGSPYDHLYLVYRNNNNQEFVIRGGPANGNPFNLGNIIVEAGVPISESEDNRGSETPEERGSRLLNLDGRSAEDVWNIMVQHVQDIGAANLQYIPIIDAQNSNSVIASVLSTLGISLIANIPYNSSEEDLPGFGNLLNFSRSLNGTNSDDIILGYKNDDVLSGSGGNDKLSGLGGLDNISGNDGNDSILGGEGSDILNGGSGVDTLVGGAGNDELDGSSGNDTLVGGIGNDTFIIGTAAGTTDFISDFEAGNVNEKVDLSAFMATTNYGSFSSFRNTNITQNGGDAVISLPNGQSITLTGVNKNSLVRDNFIYDFNENDSLVGTSGNDNLIGGAGNDFIYKSQPISVITLNGCCN